MADRGHHPVDPAGRVVDNLHSLVAVVVDEVDVVSGPAFHVVGAGLAIQRVVASSAEQAVVSAPAVEDVVPAAALEAVAEGAAGDDVVEGGHFVEEGEGPAGELRRRRAARAADAAGDAGDDDVGGQKVVVAEVDLDRRREAVLRRVVVEVEARAEQLHVVAAERQERVGGAVVRAARIARAEIELVADSVEEDRLCRGRCVDHGHDRNSPPCFVSARKLTDDPKRAQSKMWTAQHLFHCRREIPLDLLDG